MSAPKGVTLSQGQGQTLPPAKTVIPKEVQLFLEREGLIPKDAPEGTKIKLSCTTLSGDKSAKVTVIAHTSLKPPSAQKQADAKELKQVDAKVKAAEPQRTYTLDQMSFILNRFSKYRTVNFNGNIFSGFTDQVGNLIVPKSDLSSIRFELQQFDTTVYISLMLGDGIRGIPELIKIASDVAVALSRKLDGITNNLKRISDETTLKNPIYDFNDDRYVVSALGLRFSADQIETIISQNKKT